MLEYNKIAGNKSSSLQTRTRMGIAAVAGHESVHATDPKNIKGQYDKRKYKINLNLEIEPVKVENRILKETGAQQIKPIKPITINKVTNVELNL